MVIKIDENVSIRILNSGRILLEDSPVGLIIDGRSLCLNPKIAKTANKHVDQLIKPIVRIKADRIKETYNELELMFRGDFSIVFRAYNEGVSYRFKTKFKKERIIVNNELLELNLPASTDGFLMKEEKFCSMSETPYVCSPVEQYVDNTLYSFPALFRTKNNDFLLVTESGICDYPGMWLTKKDGKFQAVLPQRVTKTESGNCLSERYATERADYLAETKGSREYPWRLFVVTDSEHQLITNQLVYLLATPAPDADYSWIKPGIATLDWWGRRNIFGTDFKGGVNTETHKYFVDFNHKYGIKYFVLDKGWSDDCDLKKINANLDLDELGRYAKQKGVDLILWVHAFALKQDIPGYLDFIKSKGAAGIKVDFIERDDQEAINLFHDFAREALKRELIVDFHGVCKPFGLNRSYPNVLTSEGLIEFEMNGVTDWANPQHHTLLPFIRMVAGPMDYLPGTFNNAQKKEFYMYRNRPVGLGSRCHSMALSVIYESPITMLPDAPSDYLKEDECASFISQIPVVWDETKVIAAKIGEYVVVARRNGDNWFIGAITNWDSRELVVNLDFLGENNYTLECFTDGINTNNRAIDYKQEKYQVNSKSSITMSLSNGGGWVGKFSRP